MRSDREFYPQMKGELAGLHQEKIVRVARLLITRAEPAAESAKQQTSNHLNGIQAVAGRANIHRAGPQRALETSANPLQFLYLFCYSYPV